MRNWVILGALVAPASVQAVDLEKPRIAPPPAWVVPTPLPPLDGKPTEAPVAILLRDQQLHLSPDGDQLYVESLVRVQTPEGLNAMGTIALPWKPDNGPMILHKVRILRAGKEIDLLKDGSAITVIRRENNLELATLDGVLTAVIQVEGLRVGDIIDMAVTNTDKDPVLAGHSEGALNAASPLPVGELRMRAIWDGKAPIRWRAAPAMLATKESRHDGLNELDVQADNVQPTLLPKGAPMRFAQVGFTEFTNFRSWADLSALFAPLYAKAETLKPDSPLKAEVIKIATASTDPVKQAEAALALVQNQTRYFALALGDGGLRPADADVTWERRFADCKGKTVLLLALLHGLRIQAEPAIVSTRLGDGLDQHLPMAGLFDHIIVRATIGGKVYWLDGTRIGDQRLADIEVPPFHWALPIRAAGGALERLLVPPSEKPTAVYRYRLDLTAGASRPGPMHLEETTRGDEARGLKLALAGLTTDVRDRRLRDYVSRRYDDFTVASVTTRFDDATGEATIVADGTLAHDFSKFRYDPENSQLGFDADFDRKDGISRDAPYAVAYPRYVTTEQTVLLPNDGTGFTTGGGNVATTVAGVEYKRDISLKGGTYHITTSERALAPEFPASEAAAAQSSLRALKKDGAWIATTAAYRLTRQEEDAALGQDDKTAQGYLRRGQIHFRRREFAQAIPEFDKAIALEPKSATALYLRGLAKGALRAADRGLADFDAAIAVDGKMPAARAARAGALFDLGRREEAMAEMDKAVVLMPDQPDMWMSRALMNEMLGRHQQALADTDSVLKLKPMMPAALSLRMQVFQAMKQPDKAAAEAKALVEAKPDDVGTLMVAAPLYLRLGRKDEARTLYDRAIAIAPTVDAYVGRARTRAWNDFDGRRGDLDGALKIKPDFETALRSKVENDIAARSYDAAIATAGRLLERMPTYSAMLADRGAAYALTGRAALAAQDFAAARRAAAGDAQKLNDLCWTKAINAVALQSALEDCDAALKLLPDAAAILDSRAFVLFRLGRYADAIAAYDQALAKSPNQAASLYGRGLAKRRANRTSDGDADIALAKQAAPSVVDEFAAYGLTS